MEFDLKWVHMARYELIFRLEGALWHTIIFKARTFQKNVFPTNKDLFSGFPGFGIWEIQIYGFWDYLCQNNGI